MRERIVFMGLGHLGMKAVRYAHERGANIVGAVDVNPELVGKNLGRVCDVSGLDVSIVSSIADALDVGADTLILTTVSTLVKVMPQLQQAIEVGLDVVSTCEELVYPWGTSDRMAKKIDELAQRHGVSVLATGVNPGFLMDYLPSVLTGLCHRVEKVKVERFQDATLRRKSFQLKIGAGLTREEFDSRAQAGILRHVGLRESVAMVAAAVGWKLDRIEEEVFPVIAERELPPSPAGVLVKAGAVAGVEQFGRGWQGGEELINLHFRAALGEAKSHERISIKGLPDLESTIASGVHGDVATCAVLLNAADRVTKLKPGLRTMLDLPVLGCGQQALCRQPVGA